MKYRTTMKHWDVDYGEATYHWDTNHEPTTNEVMDYMQQMDADFYQAIYADRDPNDNKLTRNGLMLLTVTFLKTTLKHKILTTNFLVQKNYKIKNKDIMFLYNLRLPKMKFQPSSEVLRKAPEFHKVYV